MNTVTKLAAFAAALAVTFGSALAVGAAVGPIDVSGSADGAHSAMIADRPTVATVGAYTVTLAGTPAIGAGKLSFTVQLDGETVRTDPYLGASGRLLAIRDGDLALIQGHPHEDATGPVVTFTSDFPTAGRYRLFFDFSHSGTVHTAAFTVDVPSAGHGGDAPMDTHSSDTTAGH